MMDYKEKYEVALEKAKTYLNSGECVETTKKFAEICFPELTESEDERIRNVLVKMAKVPRKEIYKAEGITKEQALAWLEKQKEQKIARWKSLGECSDIPDGHYVVGWFRFGDFRLGVMCNGLFVDPNGNRAEQPKEVFYIPNANEEFVYAEQKPAEWSEEDELMRTAVIQTLEIFGGRGTTEMQIAWLKSLRNHWKPSEEQIEYLAKAIDTLDEEGDCKTAAVLNELRCDIKKLLK